ncbi:HlyD family efflux transporter periplasmic adaptor subunit [Streptomyces sp. NPDC001833]|uniref:HlyD family efflux transporter periplasmic adaptor subunit n=1 Tax=Streptomyces sp. NPDC001833 TaxID=3154658 RepID=UPI0033199BB5
MALAVVGVLVIAGAVWAVTGSIPRQATAAGILTHTEGSVYLQSSYEGQIVGVFVGTGASFPAGSPLFTVQDGGKQFTVRSVTGGRVISVLGRVGQVISKGAQLAVIERIDDKNDPLAAMVYLPQTQSGLVRPGSAVDLTVESAPAQQFGVLRGTVESVDQFPQTRHQIAQFLGDDQLAARFTSTGQPIGVVVRLTPGRTPSGFAWSTGRGPSFHIDSRTLVSAAIHLPPIKPVNWVVA